MTKPGEVGVWAGIIDFNEIEAYRAQGYLIHIDWKGEDAHPSDADVWAATVAHVEQYLQNGGEWAYRD